MAGVFILLRSRNAPFFDTLNTACHVSHLLLKMGTKKGAFLLRNKIKTPAISDGCPM